MHKELDVTAGTIFAEILAFDGKMELVSETKEKDLLFEEKEIGTMTELEKIIFTLTVIKRNERLKIRELIIGKTVTDFSDEEKQTFNDYMDHPANSATNNRYEQLKEEGNVLRNLMWSLIKLRLKTEDPAI